MLSEEQMTTATALPPSISHRLSAFQFLVTFFTDFQTRPRQWVGLLNTELTCALIDRLKEFAGGAAAADCEWPDVRQTTRRHNAQWRIQSVQWPLMQLTTISSCRSVVGACTTELKLYTNRPFIHIERGDPGGHTRWKTIKVQNANLQMNFL